MKVFLDTNVLVAASIRQHPHFTRADAVLARCVAGEDLGVSGGVVYDLFHLAVAEAEDVDRLWTFNVAHFRGLADPAWRDRVAAP